MCILTCTSIIFFWGWDFASNQPIWSSVTWSKVVLNSDSNFPRHSTLNIPCTRGVQSPLSANTYTQFRSLHSANTHSFILHSRRIRTVSFSTLGEYAQFHSPLSANTHSFILHSRRIRTVSFSTLGKYAQFHSPLSANTHSFFLHTRQLQGV